MALTKKELKNKSKSLKPILQIGKAGLSANTISHIKVLIQKHKLIKIKILRSFKDQNSQENPNQTPKNFAESLANQVNANLIDHVGLTISLCKKN